MKKLQLMIFAVSMCSGLFFLTSIGGNKHYHPSLKEMLGNDSQVAEICRFTHMYIKSELNDQEIERREKICSHLETHLQKAQKHYEARQEIGKIRSKLNTKQSPTVKQARDYKLQQLMKEFPHYNKSYVHSLLAKERSELKNACKQVLSWLPADQIEEEASLIDNQLAGKVDSK